MDKSKLKFVNKKTISLMQQLPKEFGTKIIKIYKDYHPYKDTADMLICLDSYLKKTSVYTGKWAKFDLEKWQQYLENNTKPEMHQETIDYFKKHQDSEIMLKVTEIFMQQFPNQTPMNMLVKLDMFLLVSKAFNNLDEFMIDLDEWKKFCEELEAKLIG